MTAGDAASVEIRVMRLPGAADLPLPRQATPQSSGFDLRARVDGVLELAPGDRALVPSGIALALPPGYGLSTHKNGNPN